MGLQLPPTAGGWQSGRALQSAAAPSRKGPKDTHKGGRVRLGVGWASEAHKLEEAV